MQAKAIIFDYGGVLCFHPPEQQVRELAAKCRLGIDEFLRNYWGLRAAYDRGDISPGDYWREIGLSANLNYTEDEIAEFRRGDIAFWVHLDRHMMDWAAKVRSAGILTGLLSNLPADLGAHLRDEMHLPDSFDHHTFSYEIRAAKPDPAIYRHAVDGLGIHPAEALFLDDRPENVEGARAAGLRAIQFESPRKLSAQLAELARTASDSVPLGTPPIIFE